MVQKRRGFTRFRGVASTLGVSGGQGFRGSMVCLLVLKAGVGEGNIGALLQGVFYGGYRRPSWLFSGSTPPRPLIR